MILLLLSLLPYAAAEAPLSCPPELSPSSRADCQSRQIAALQTDLVRATEQIGALQTTLVGAALRIGAAEGEIDDLKKLLLGK